MCGIIVQLPLPMHLERQKVLDAIDSHLDVDCLGMKAGEEFYKNYKDKSNLDLNTWTIIELKKKGFYLDKR